MQILTQDTGVSLRSCISNQLLHTGTHFEKQGAVPPESLVGILAPFSSSPFDSLIQRVFL